MNNEDKKVLVELKGQIEEITLKIADVRCDESITFFSLSDSVRDGEKGNKHKEVIDYLDDVIGCLDNAVADLECALEGG